MRDALCTILPAVSAVEIREPSGGNCVHDTESLAACLMFVFRVWRRLQKLEQEEILVPSVWDKKSTVTCSGRSEKLRKIAFRLGSLTFSAETFTKCFAGRSQSGMHNNQRSHRGQGRPQD